MHRLHDVLQFLSDPGLLVRSMCLDVTHSLSEQRCVNLTDLTLADKDTNSILTDNTNISIQANVAMQVTQPSGQVCNFCKWRHLMANEPMQVTWLKLK